MLERARLFRNKADVERRAAAATNLPNVRQRHLHAAEQWEKKAEFEDAAHCAREANSAAKRAMAQKQIAHDKIRARLFARHAR